MNGCNRFLSVARKIVYRGEPGMMGHSRNTSYISEKSFQNVLFPKFRIWMNHVFRALLFSGLKNYSEKWFKKTHPSPPRHMPTKIWQRIPLEEYFPNIPFQKLQVYVWTIFSSARIICLVVRAPEYLPTYLKNLIFLSTELREIDCRIYS